MIPLDDVKMRAETRMNAYDALPPEWRRVVRYMPELCYVAFGSTPHGLLPQDVLSSEVLESIAKEERR